MKKFIAIMLGASAMIACTKTSVSYEPTGEIAFAPVSNVNKTKATFEGATFPEANPIYTYAYYKDKVATTPASSFADATTYLDNKLFKKNGTTWAGSDGTNHTPYYWPKNGSLIFCGYTPAVEGMSHNFGVEGDVITDEFKKNDFVQPNVTSNTIDLMWSPVSSSSMSSGTVSMKFIHAMSWITFNVSADTADVFALKSIEIKNVVNKANFSTAADLVNWKLSTAEDDIKNIVVYNANQAITKTSEVAETIANGTVVIPQDLASVTVELTYTQKAPSGKLLEQTHSIALKDCKVKNAPISVWEFGKHYIYNLNFTLKGDNREILISPVVKEWDKVESDGIDIK